MKTEKTSGSGLTLSYSFLQGLYWILDVALLTYVTPLLEERGFAPYEIGIINGCKSAAMIVFQYVLSSYADRHADTVTLKSIMTILTLAASGATAALLFAPNVFFLVLLCFVAIGMTMNSLLPMLESLSIQYMKTGESLNYSVSRAVGSLTYAVFCLLMGAWTEKWGVDFAIKSAIPMFGLFLIGNIFMKPVDRTRLSEANHQSGTVVHSAGHLLRHYPKYRWFLVEVLLLMTGFNMNIAFLIDRARELGGGTGLYGLLMAVIGFAEIPTALFFPKLREYVSIEKLMFVMGIFCTARAVGTSFAGNVPVLTIVQILEMAGMAIYYPGAVYFVMKYVPVQDSVKGTSLLNIASFGISAVFSALASGAIMQVFGLQALFNVSCLVSALAIGAGALMLKAPAKTE